jgi:hypothetical protein
MNSKLHHQNYGNCNNAKQILEIDQYNTALCI